MLQRNIVAITLLKWALGTFFQYGYCILLLDELSCVSECWNCLHWLRIVLIFAIAFEIAPVSYSCGLSVIILFAYGFGWFCISEVNNNILYVVNICSKVENIIIFFNLIKNLCILSFGNSFVHPIVRFAKKFLQLWWLSSHVLCQFFNVQRYYSMFIRVYLEFTSLSS